MSERGNALSRQWVPIAGGSCDVRMGFDALEQGSKLFKGSVGTPRLCMVVQGAGTDEQLVERLRRQLVDAGFEVHYHLAGARTIDEAAKLFQALAAARVTGDDLCCAIGDADVISLATFVSSAWCLGMPLVAIPLNEAALFDGVLSPRALDVGDLKQMATARPYARHVLLDYDLALSPLASEESRYARTVMAATAMLSSERAFSELWDRCDELMGGDEVLYAKQLMTTAKARGQAMASTAIATRQAVGYGMNIARALRRVTPQALPFSLLLAEGMRFASRLSAAMGKLSIDDMLAQDELLEALGVGTVECDVDPAAFVAALKEERFLRTNRFMLLVPLSIGRVRLTSVEDSMLLEHACAWCQAHAAS